MSSTEDSRTHNFSVFCSNRQEILLDHLAEFVSNPLSSPFEKEIILIQSKGMERWLAQQLARKCGIWANGSFPFPNAMVRGIFRLMLDPLPEDALFSPELMVWRILRLLPAQIHRPGFEVLKNYLGEEMQGLKALQLCQKIADVFDQYTLYRPAMVLDWEKGKGEGWQPELWRILVADCTQKHRAALRSQILELLEKAAIADRRLPARISVFGIPVLPPFHLEILHALSKHAQVAVFLMNPCRQYWGDLASKKQIFRDQSKSRSKGRDPSESHLEIGNALLASMGKLGGEFLNLLLDREAYKETCAYYDPGESSLLACIQSDILNLRDRGRDGDKKHVPAEDASIQIHSLHSPMREMEVLHDHLLSLFEEMEDLAPHDILVMTPQIETYAAYISAVFGVAEHPSRRIPFSIADRSPKTESLVIQAFLKMLNLSGSRFGVTEVLDVLDSPVVRRRFRLAPENMEPIHNWLHNTGIRWGIDGKDRQRFGVPEFEENSWQEGLRRLLLGYALPIEQNRFFADILPFDDVEGSESLILGRFADFVLALFGHIRALEAPRNAQEWRDCLHELLDRFIHVDEDAEWEAQIIRSRLNDLAAHAALGGFSEPISIEAVRYWLETKLQSELLSQGFLGGGVTFCEMLPMRSIPFRVIALVGMNSGAFPRQGRPPGFDLIASSPSPGDRSLRDEDRYLFLEALLSARERLYISYVGQSITDNSEIPPSPIVSELLDYIDQGFEPSIPSNFIMEQLVVRHRLQAFSPAYFEGNARLFSYSVENLSALLSRQSEPQQPAPFLLQPIAAPPDDWKRLDIQTLKRFYRQPVEFFLRQRLGIVLQEQPSVPEDSEPFSLDDLTQYILKQELVAELLQGGNLSQTHDIVRSRGILPPGAAGEAIYAETVREARRFARRIQPYLGSRPFSSHEIRLELAGFYLAGTVGDLLPNFLLRYRCASIKPKDQLAAWIDHLILNCLDNDGQPRQSVVIGSDLAYRFLAVPEAKEILAGILRIYWEGLQAPLPFFPQSSFAYAESLAQDSDAAEALGAAKKAWYASRYKRGRAEEEDPYNHLAFKNMEPLGEQFEYLAQTIVEPLLKHRQKEL